MKLIPLSQGQFAMVNDCKYDYLIQFNWYAIKDKVTYYAKRNVRINGKLTTQFLHRLILGTENPKTLIDHKDGNGLNNLRSNIRECDKSENAMNSRAIVKTSAFKGVCFDKSRGKFRSNIIANNKQNHLGYFDDETIAAKAYDSAAKLYFGEFAYTNFK